MILFFGPPGSGKSAQGRLLVEREGWYWLSTGRLFRDSVDPLIQERLKAGELLDDLLVNQALDEALRSLKTHKIILDGYPRTLKQARWLEEHIGDYDERVELAILFEVPESELAARLSSRGRPEDIPGVIKRRLEIYHEALEPLLNFYKGAAVPVKIIDGLGDMEAVHRHVKEVIATCLSA